MNPSSFLRCTTPTAVGHGKRCKPWRWVTLLVQWVFGISTKTFFWNLIECLSKAFPLDSYTNQNVCSTNWQPEPGWDWFYPSRFGELSSCRRTGCGGWVCLFSEHSLSSYSLLRSDSRFGWRIGSGSVFVSYPRASYGHLQLNNEHVSTDATKRHPLLHETPLLSRLLRLLTHQTGLSKAVVARRLCREKMAKEKMMAGKMLEIEIVMRNPMNLNRSQGRRTMTTSKTTHD